MPKVYAKKPPQKCSTPDCEKLTAYKTNSKPAYCLDCIDGIFASAGLKLLEPFNKPDDYYLCECLVCGEKAHYRFNYLLSRGGVPTGDLVCSACKWKHWYHESNSMYPQGVGPELSIEEARLHAREHGCELLKIIEGEYPGQSLYVTQCLTCGRIQIDRRGEFPIEHKCRHPETIDVHSVCHPNKVVKAEPSYPVTDNQKIVAREYRPDNHISNLRDLSWWDFERNDNKKIFLLTTESRKDAWVFCASCGESFLSPMAGLFTDSNEFFGICPTCREKRKRAFDQRWGMYKSSTVADYPDLLSHWADEDDPSEVTLSTHILYKWACDSGHYPRQTPSSFLESGCSVCRGLKTKELASLTEAEYRIPSLVPYELRDQWHPVKNVSFEYGKTHIGANRLLWWKCDHCGYEWEESVRDRTRIHEYGAWTAWHQPYCRCPECGGTLDSLAWHYPSLAKEWSGNNPVSAWDIRPNGQIDFIPEWVCAVDPTHVWSMPLASRVRGAQCPECAEAGKSRIERKYLNAAKQFWGNSPVKSGLTLRDETFTRPWVVDIFIGAGIPLIIEYDGSYWHADKVEVDVRKSKELLAVGYRLVRLREFGLKSLEITNQNYLELEVSPNGIGIQDTLKQIDDWLYGHLSENR